MPAPRTHRSTTRGLVALVAAIALSVVSLALGLIWTSVLAVGSLSPAAAASIRTTWMPISSVLVDSLCGLFGLVGFLLVWRGRWEVGGEYASRIGLALLAALVAAVAYGLFALTGILLGYVSGVGFLSPWHALFAVVGAVFLGLGLYGILANLPLAGSRPLAAVALALGLIGITLVNLSALDLRRVRTAGLEGAGLGLALASLAIWLVLCLWGEENIRNRALGASAARASSGS